MLVGEADLALGEQHAVGFLAADHALLEQEIGAGNVAAGRGEDAFMPVRALGPPQTTWTSPEPVSTMQTLSRSASGWGRASLT